MHTILIHMWGVRLAARVSMQRGRGARGDRTCLKEAGGQVGQGGGNGAGEDGEEGAGLAIQAPA